MANVGAKGPEAASLFAAAVDAESVADWNLALDRYLAACARFEAAGDMARAAETLRSIGRIRRHRGDIDGAVAAYERSLALAESNGLRSHVAQALNCLGIVEQHRGRPHAAEACYARARDIAAAVGETRLTAMIDQNLGTLADIRGDADAALGHYDAALPTFRELGDVKAVAWTLNNIGMAHTDLGNLEDAEASFDEAFERADSVRDLPTLARIELNRAALYLKNRDNGRTRECCDRAFEIFSACGSQADIAEVLRMYGVLFRETGKPNLAESQLEQAATLAAIHEDRLLVAEIESERALVRLAQGANADALEHLTRAQQLFEELQARREVLDLDRRLDRLEEKFLAVVRAWGESIESKDRYTAGHCRRVADYACLLAGAVGFEPRELNWLRMGAFLHDVGKTAVPAEILNKPGALTEEEREIMQRHTTVGHEIVSRLDFPWNIAPMVRSHHEHWDGGGYPDGLAGERIPLTARILCIADVYDALTTARSYRPALSHEEAIRIMERDSGRILDPVLFERFRKLLDGRRVDSDAA